MKLNQYGRLTPDVDTQYAELKRIGFAVDPEADFAAIANVAFNQLFPQAETNEASQEAMAQVAVSETQNLADFLAGQPEKMTRVQFYAMALQLLGFEPENEFSMTDPLAFMDKTKLPYVDHDLENAADFYQALYLLLTTRTKSLVNFLDALATQGFFKDFQKGKKTPQYLFFNGKAQNVFDARKLHREVVWVESDLDTDHDGQRDLLETTIFRPEETDAGVKMPVLFTANPYFHGTNDIGVKAITHVPSPTVAVKTQSHTKEEVTFKPQPKPDLPKPEVTASTKKAEVYADENGIYSLNDYFLGRGFVTVYSAGVGTQGSDGVRSTGGQSETDSAVAVIEWLTGKRRAFTNRKRTATIEAWWSNGKVAMTGKSYLGTLAIAAATSGVDGLKTVISESAISSWYDYYRENGLVVAPGGFQGEDADVLGVDTFSRQKKAGDYYKILPTWKKALADITEKQDRTTGDYSAWWDERNYRNNLKNIKCDVVSVHGLNDWNVKPKNVIKFWNGLRDLPIQKKLFLHQGQHVYLNNVRSIDFTDMMNLWLSYELLDVQNDAPKVIPNVTVQDNVEPETFNTYKDFGTESTAEKLNLKSDFKSIGASFADNATKVFTDNHETSDSYELEIVKPHSLYDASRLWLVQDPADHDRILEGIPELTLRLWIDQPTAILSARLVDVGDAKRFLPNASAVGSYPLGFDYKTDRMVEFKQGPETASKLISFGHVNLQNRENAYETYPITSGQPFTVHFEMQPTHMHLPAGRNLVLILHGADMAQTQRPTLVTNYHIDLENSFLKLPFRKD